MAIASIDLLTSYSTLLNITVSLVCISAFSLYQIPPSLHTFHLSLFRRLHITELEMFPDVPELALSPIGGDHQTRVWTLVLELIYCISGGVVGKGGAAW